MDLRERAPGGTDARGGGTDARCITSPAAAPSAKLDSGAFSPNTGASQRTPQSAS
ncbi:MAG: hypothetical protein AMXMBFR56_57320 [Polyangiaceae bacterium]